MYILYIYTFMKLFAQTTHLIQTYTQAYICIYIYYVFVIYIYICKHMLCICYLYKNTMYIYINNPMFFLMYIYIHKYYKYIYIYAYTKPLVGTMIINIPNQTCNRTIIRNIIVLTFFLNQYLIPIYQLLRKYSTLWIIICQKKRPTFPNKHVSW